MGSPPDRKGGSPVDTIGVTFSPTKLEWAAAAGISVAAAFLAVVPGTPTPVDEVLPLLAGVAVMFAAMSWQFPWRFAPLAAVPLLIGMAIGVPDPSLRALSYGAVLSASALLAALSSMVEGRISTFRAGLLAAVCVAMLHLIGLRAQEIVPALIAVTSAVLLTSVFSHLGSVAPAGLALSIAAGVIVPFHPLRSSLMLPAILLALWFVRRPRASAAACALLLAAAAGWVPLLIVLLLLATPLVATAAPDRASLVAFPAAGALGSLVAAPLLFHPALLRDLFRTDLFRMATAGSLLCAAAFLRPQQAAMAIIAAAAVMVLDHRGHSPASELPPAVFCAALLLLFAWSGVTSAQFPFPLPLAAIAMASAIALVPSIPALRQGAGIVAFAGACALLFWSPNSVTVQNEEVALRGGESHVMRPVQLVRSLWVVASGANLTAIKTGTVVGSVDVIDDVGHGWRRDLRIGEIADWGAFRREVRFLSANVLPGDPAGPWVGYGERAFPVGSGRIKVGTSRPIAIVQVTASRDLPPDARLHVERLELPAP
jgi:hypothetical protein